ncbi:hypothetical protein [Clostridium estertheticum]|uniref:Uncharacterized protein n=1 Tax=Clostridium estertheticum TaxID=238834 RepID=A0AA47I8U2_9CLOT|nr:hypothetical protein [Clostridium estertheticum]WAG62450.1 hypothetical protein LL038_09525 [Clostridium estertheticum]
MKNKKILASLTMCFALMVGMTNTAGAATSSNTSNFMKALGSNTGFDTFDSVQQTSDGGYIAAGSFQSADGDFAGVSHKGLDDATLVKFNSNGSTGWIKSIGGTKGDMFNSVQQTSDGGYIAAGCSESTDGDFAGVGNKGSLDATLIKFNKNGTTEWIKDIGGKNIDRFYSVQQTLDGGYIAAGYSESSNGDFTGVGNKGSADAILVKFDKNGTIEWTKATWGGLNDYFRSVQQTSDGGYIAAGNSESGNGDFTGVNKGSADAILVKFDKSGTTEWIKDVGGSDSDGLSSVQQTSDGGYIAVAHSASIDGDFTGVSNKGTGGAIIIKFNKSGTTEWIKNFSDSGFAGAGFSSVQQTSDGGYVAAGTSFLKGGYLVAGYEKMLLVKFNKSGTSEWFKSFGGAKFGDKFNSVQQTSDGGYVAVGDSTDGATLIKSDNTAITVDSTALRPTGVNASINSSAVAKIDLVSTQLTNTGNNTATFKYKILNTVGINITQKIPASQIKAAASVITFLQMGELIIGEKNNRDKVIGNYTKCKFSI